MTIWCKASFLGQKQTKSLSLFPDRNDFSSHHQVAGEPEGREEVANTLRGGRGPGRGPGVYVNATAAAVGVIQLVADL